MKAGNSQEPLLFTVAKPFLSCRLVKHFLLLHPELNYKAFLRSDAQARHTGSVEAECTQRKTGCLKNPLSQRNFCLWLKNTAFGIRLHSHLCNYLLMNE